MYKVLLLLQPSQNLDATQLVRDWAALPSHDDEAAGAPVRHELIIAIPGAIPIENVTPATFEAFAEFWFVDKSTAQCWFGSCAFKQFWPAHSTDLLSGPPLALSKQTLNEPQGTKLGLLGTGGGPQLQSYAGAGRSHFIWVPGRARHDRSATAHGPHPGL